MDRRARQRIAPVCPPEGSACCLHGALPGACAFAGCLHFRVDGPRDEKWAFRPGTTQEDIDAALVENVEALKVPPHCASPIHLVVERYRRRRTGEDRWVFLHRPAGGYQR